MRLLLACFVAGTVALVRLDYRRFKREVDLTLRGARWARR